MSSCHCVKSKNQFNRTHKHLHSYLLTLLHNLLEFQEWAQFSKCYLFSRIWVHTHLGSPPSTDDRGTHCCLCCLCQWLEEPANYDWGSPRGHSRLFLPPPTTGGAVVNSLKTGGAVADDWGSRCQHLLTLPMTGEAIAVVVAFFAPTNNRGSRCWRQT